MELGFVFNVNYKGHVMYHHISETSDGVCCVRRESIATGRQTDSSARRHSRSYGETAKSSDRHNGHTRCCMHRLILDEKEDQE